MLREAGVRISIPHYFHAVQDADYVRRFAKRTRSKEFRKTAANITMESIVDEAKQLGVVYRLEFQQAWQAFKEAKKMQRKWQLSRLRYLLGRLVLIAPDKDLNIYSKQLETETDLAEYAATFKALAKRDVSELLRFSGKINAGAGQALATMRRPIRCRPTRWSREAVEGYLVLRLLGVDTSNEPPKNVQRQTQVRFTNGTHDKHDWLQAPNGFLQELLALAGECTLDKHRAVLQEPIDPDERWVLFADELRGISS